MRRSPARSSTPQWITTAAHLAPGSPEGRMPWGLRHVKQEGAARTACGEPAAHWRLFRHVRFDPVATDSCQRCAKAMVL